MIFRILIILFFNINFALAYSVYDISSEEYMMYKKDANSTLELLKNKYFYKKITNEESNKKIVKNNKNVTKVDNNYSKVPKIEQLEKIKVTQKDIKNDKITTKSQNKSINISEKAQINKKTDMITLKAVIQSLQYNNILKNKDLESLIRSINFYFKEKEIGVEPQEVELVIMGIHKKRYSPFESNLYLKQLKDFLKD